MTPSARQHGRGCAAAAKLVRTDTKGRSWRRQIAPLTVWRKEVPADFGRAQRGPWFARIAGSEARPNGVDGNGCQALGVCLESRDPRPTIEELAVLSGGTTISQNRDGRSPLSGHLCRSAPTGSRPLATVLAGSASARRVSCRAGRQTNLSSPARPQTDLGSEPPGGLRRGGVDCG